MRGAIDPKQADRGGNGRLRIAGRAALEARERLEGPLVANPSEREHGIILQWAVEPGDGDQGCNGMARLELAECVDHRAPEEILAPARLAHDRLRDTRVRPVGRQGTHERGSDELRFLRRRCLEERRHHGFLGMVREVCVGDLSQAIVRIGQYPPHDVGAARVPVPRQDDQGPIADIPVRMLDGGLHERRDGDVFRRATDGPRRLDAGAVLEIAESIDGGRHDRRGDGVLRGHTRPAGDHHRRHPQEQRRHDQDDGPSHSATSTTDSPSSSAASPLLAGSASTCHEAGNATG